MKKTFSLFLMLPLFLVVAGVPSTMTYAAEEFNVDKAISEGDHKGLAEYYKAKAQAYRDKAASHDTMAESYKKSMVHYKGMENTMSAHCSMLKEEALKSAKQYDEMAAAEEKLAAEK